MLSAASSKLRTSVNAALDTADLSTSPSMSPSSVLILIYSPTDNALDVIAVTTVGFDSPITKPKLNLVPLLNQSHCLTPINLPFLIILCLKFYNYCVLV